MKAPIFSAYTPSKADTTEVLRDLTERATEAEYERRSQDPSTCQHCHGDGVSPDQPDGCSGCNGSGKTKRGYWNNYGRDWDYDD
jgi:DnaJ-class molecular chaperone